MKRLLFLFLLLVWSAVVGAAPGAQSSSPSTASLASASSGAPLRLFNRQVFVFRAPLMGVSAEDRARRASTRIGEQLELTGPNKVTHVVDSNGVLIQIDGATSFVITQADLEGVEGESLELAAKETMAALETVIGESRESRSMDSMLRAAGKALVALVVMLVAVRTARWIRDRLSIIILAVTDRHSERLQVGGVKLLQSERVAMVVGMLLRGMHRLFLFVVFYNWVSYTLSCFPYTRFWGETLSAFLIGLILQMGGSVLRAVPGVITALVIFFIARWVNGLLTSFFERVQTGQVQLSWLDADVVVPTRRIVKSLVWLFALAMAYPYLPGAETEAFKGLSVLAGLMISLGASNLVGQAASGLILTYGRVYRKGEYVRIAEVEGTVTEMGMFATRIRTGLGEELTIANSKILDSTTKNYSRTVKGPGFVLDTTVTIGYDTPWRQVHALLMEAAKRTEGVLTEPAPMVFQTALSDWYPEYRLVCQAIPSEPRPRAIVLSMLHANIQDVFNEYGVQIMSPQYFEDPPQPKIVHPDNWYAAPAQKPKL